jgi:hypothetical protein
VESDATEGGIYRLAMRSPEGQVSTPQDWLPTRWAGEFEQLSKAEIATRLGMSRTTVNRLPALKEPAPLRARAPAIPARSPQGQDRPSS